MLCEAYIEALLVDEELADQVWEMWEAGLILDELAAYAGGYLSNSSLFGRENTNSITCSSLWLWLGWLRFPHV